MNNPCGWKISEMLSVNGFTSVENLSEFNEGFIKSYSEKSKEGYFSEIGTQYSENLHIAQIGLPFLPERTKIEKVEKFIANLNDQTKYAIHIRNLKRALKHGSIFKKIIEPLSLI